MSFNERNKASYISERPKIALKFGEFKDSVP